MDINIGQIKSTLQLDCYRSALAALHRNGGKLHYGPKQWVPDEFEHLEKIGLVHCEFGFPDIFSQILKSRTITITEMGKSEAAQIADAKIPLYVDYSFHSALKRESKQNSIITL